MDLQVVEGITASQLGKQLSPCLTYIYIYRFSPPSRGGG